MKIGLSMEFLSQYLPTTDTYVPNVTDLLRGFILEQTSVGPKKVHP